MKSILMLSGSVFTKGLLALHLPVEIPAIVALNGEQALELRNVVRHGHSRLNVPGFLFLAHGGEEGLPSKLTVYAVNGGNELRLGSLEGDLELEVLDCLLSTWLVEKGTLPSFARIPALQLADGNDRSIWLHSKLCNQKVQAFIGLDTLVLDRGSELAGFPAKHPVTLSVKEWVTPRIANWN